MFAPDLKLWDRAVKGIRETADWASDLGITVVLQNHGPVLTPGYEDVLAMTKEVDRPNLKICLDVPMFFDRQRTDYVQDAVEKCKDYIRYTHYGAWNFSETENGDIVLDPAPNHGGNQYETFLMRCNRAMMGILLRILPPGVAQSQICGIDEIDKATQGV
jgi:sugar phosphate isomerase/epimerase